MPLHINDWAFNKMIVNDIKKRKIKNIKPYTFDALMRKLYLKNKNIDDFDFDIDIMDLNSYTFREKYTWFKNKPFRMIKSFISLYNKFCKDTTFIKIEDFINNYNKNIKILSPFTKKQIIKMWNDKLITFNSLRKIAYINKWFKSLDNNYDMVVIDEAQDFDNLMLKMLINDTAIPKIFVGDPNQSIYQWRGAVNSFEKLPEDTHVVEFYKTWRIGNPACDTIASLFPNCWMIPGTNSKTNIFNGIEPIINYDYLFRTWRSLLETACYKKNIWINNFDKKRIMIEKLHNKIHKFGIDKDADFEDDLPNFLLKLSSRELFILIENINNNLVSKELAKCKMYTIHSYKGMENDTIRIFNDIDIENESNLYYVALTRAKKNIYID